MECQNYVNDTENFHLFTELLYGNIYSMCDIFHPVLGQVILKITLNNMLKYNISEIIDSRGTACRVSLA